MPFIQARVNAALTAAVGTGTDPIAWAILHTADPGAAGTTAQGAQSSTEAISFPAVAAGSTDDQVIFTIAAAEGPYTHVSLWTDLTSAPDEFIASGVLTPQEEFAGAGELEVTVTLTAANA